jgi:hypothetical protein
VTRARLLAGCLLLVLAVPAAAAPRDNRPVRMPTRPAAPVPPAPVAAASTMPQTAIGLCQCIADRTKRNISCLSSADQCQSTCASTHYSFVPFAPSCPVTAAR